MATNDKGRTGFGGEQVQEGEGPTPPYQENLPEGSVISPVGVTRPPLPSIADPYRKTRSGDEQLAGKVHLQGKTHHGYCYERIVDILQPRTEKGMLQVFKAHFPDAVEEDFSAKAISDEEAAELEKKWAAEMQGQEKDRDTKRRKEYEEGTAANAKEQSKAREQEKEDYEALTVAELKERAVKRNIDHRHDWTKSDYVGAFKKADKNG